MSFNFIGLIIDIIMYIPFIIKTRNKEYKKYLNSTFLQLSLIDYIALHGIIIFGLFNIENIGYKIENNVLFIMFLITSSILIFILYLLYIRYIIKGLKTKNKIKYLYDTCVIKCPISFIEAIIFLFTSIILKHYIVIFFSSIYFVCHILIGLKLNKILDNE